MRWVLIALAAAGVASQANAQAPAKPLSVGVLMAAAQQICPSPLDYPGITNGRTPKGLSARDVVTVNAMCTLYWQGRLDGLRDAKGLPPAKPINE